MRGSVAVVCALLLIGCGGSDDETPAGEPLEIPEGCNPLAAEWDCLLPFPSDVFRGDDSSLPSGHRVTLGKAALKNKSGTPFDQTSLHPADGFSPGSQILALFPPGVDDSKLVFHTDDVTRSIGPESPTLLIDAESGKPVLHFAELDPRATDDARRGLVIRPLVRLDDQHRYIVAIRRIADAPEGFRRIRDKQTRGDPVLAPLAKRYEKEIFPVLASADVDRADLVLAWDFTTRSEENATRDMVAIRDDLIAKLAAKPPVFSIVKVENDPSSHVARRIEATLKIPLYLEKNEPMAKLHRDSSGNVTANGETDVPFTVVVPKSVATRPAGSPPARLLQYGHGFFGSRAEADSVPSELGDAKQFVVVATDWIGMSDADRTPLIDKLVSDPASTLIFTDRLHQAMANQIALGALAKGALASAPELQFSAGPAYDPKALYYTGNSNGHILGGTYVALAPSVERAVFGVGGANYSFIMFRAQPFGLFLIFVGQVVPDFLDQQKFGYLTQLGFDRIDPLTYAPRLVENTYPNGPPSRRVLIQVGLGDAQVNPLSAELHARALGIRRVDPGPRSIAGLDPATLPFDGSAIQEFDFHVDPLPGTEAIPPNEDTPVHEGVRRLPAAQEQLSRFLMPNGKIEPTCDAVCDPE